MYAFNMLMNAQGHHDHESRQKGWNLERVVSTSVV